MSIRAGGSSPSEPLEGNSASFQRPKEAVRAFGVMLGGPLLLVAAALASAAATLRSLMGFRLPHPVALLGCTLTGLYVLVVRPWHLRWGAEPGELERPLPGDEFLPDRGTDILHATTIDAPVAQVWPWLAQIGQDRGGFYSYEWLENLAGCRMRNADAIHPEWQELKPGETVWLHPRAGMEVTLIEPGRAIGLKPWGTFVLEPLGPERTRLLVRSRAPGGFVAAAYAALVEIPHFLMERRMLLGIKERAERTVPKERHDEAFLS